MKIVVIKRTGFSKAQYDALTARIVNLEENGVGGGGSVVQETLASSGAVTINLEVLKAYLIQQTGAITISEGTAGKKVQTLTIDADGSGVTWPSTWTVTETPTTSMRNLYVIQDIGFGDVVATLIATKAIPDSAAPTLSALSTSATSDTTGTLSATSSEDGTVYWIAKTTNVAPATHADVVAGTDGVDFGSIAATAATAASGTIDTLTASTIYYIFGFAEDVDGNQSAIVSFGSFTTNATGDVTNPTVTSVTAVDSHTIDVVLSEIVTSTTAGWTFKRGATVMTVTAISGSGTNTLRFTVTDIISKTDALTASYDPAIGDCVDGTGNELIAITDRAFDANNVTTLITDDFTGTTINPVACTVSNPNNPPIDIYQSGSLVLASVISAESIPAYDNNVQYNDSYTGELVMAIDLTRVPSIVVCAFGFWNPANGEKVLIFRGADKAKARMLVTGGVSDQTTTIDMTGKRWKVKRGADGTLTIKYWNTSLATPAWSEPVAPVAAPAWGADPFKIFFAQGVTSTEAATSYYDRLRVTDFDYDTELPA